VARWVKSKNSMRIFKQTATPAVVDGLAVGDIWIDINSGAIEKVCTNVSPVTFAQNSNSVSGTVGTTTNDSATAGYVGELLSADLLTASKVSLTTATATDVISKAFTAGDWDIWFIPAFVVNPGVTTVTRYFWWVSTASASLPALGKDLNVLSLASGTIPASSTSMGVTTTHKRFSLASTTTIYASVYADFGASTLQTYGSIYGRRVR